MKVRQTTVKQTWRTTTRKNSKNRKRRKKPNPKRPQRIKKNRKNREDSHLRPQRKKLVANQDRDHQQSKASRVERKTNQDKNRNQFRGVDQEVDRNQKQEEKLAKIGNEISPSKSKLTIWKRKILKIYLGQVQKIRRRKKTKNDLRVQRNVKRRKPKKNLKLNVAKKLKRRQKKVEGSSHQLSYRYVFENSFLLLLWCLGKGKGKNSKTNFKFNNSCNK